jgi:small subunit ribosomal protein S6
VSKTRDYELTIVYPPQATAKEADPTEVVKQLLKKYKAKVLTEEAWGEKDLAYPIRKHERGIYHHFVLAMDADVVPDFRRAIELEKNLLRWLMVLVDEPVNAPKNDTKDN